MKNVQTKKDLGFDDLPLFRVSRHLEIWESLPQQVQEKTIQLTGDLLLAHVAASQKGGTENE